MKPDKIVCNCMSVTVRMIQDAIESGADSLDEVQAVTQAGTVCGACMEDLERVVEALLKEKNEGSAH